MQGHTYILLGAISNEELDDALQRWGLISSSTPETEKRSWRLALLQYLETMDLHLWGFIKTPDPALKFANGEEGWSLPSNVILTNRYAFPFPLVISSS